jgi:hypothetical protein
MIQFEITTSPDKNVLSQFRYLQNLIYIGRTTGDLWIDDQDLLPSHLMIEVIGNELLVHPQKGVDFYLLNGKRASQIRKIKVNDQITIGKTVFKILSFSEIFHDSKKDILNQKLSQLIEANASRLTVVEKLTKLMKE